MKKHSSEYLTATRQFVGDGEYWLHLRAANMIALEQRFDFAMSRVYGALIDGLYEDAEGRMKLYGGSDIRPSVLNEILRQALIGGNAGPDLGQGEEVGPQRADSLIKLYGYPERPVEEVAALAFRVLHAAMVGDPEQRKALPDIAAESDKRSKKLARQVGERLGPTMRKRAEASQVAE